jgi:3',5'-nucleoside bisphosphate phosphatase
MNYYAVDMHIHTVLSPCASDEMTPMTIVKEAIKRNLAMIAISDHNSAGNADAVRRAAGNELVVLSGIEITTAEEAHVLGIFPDHRSAASLAERILETLPFEMADSRIFGEQVFMDENDRPLGKETRMLSSASSFSLSEVVGLIRARGGLAIASHIDRPSFSVISQLGLMPEDVCFDALEISAAGVALEKMKDFEVYGLPLVTSSDSHTPDRIGACVSFLEAPEPSFAELALALKKSQGRRCFIA